MSGVYVASQPGEYTAGVALPVRREQPRERRDEVATAVIVDRAGQVLDLGRSLDHLQIVTQPLHQRTGDGDGALEAIHRRLIADLVAQGCQQAALGLHGLGTGVEQQEVTGPVGVLCVTNVVAGLSEGGRLLIAQVTGNRDPLEHSLRLGVDLAGCVNLGQHRARHVERLEDVVVPLQGLEIHHHGAARVGNVRHVDAAGGATGEVPDAPGVDVSEHDVAGIDLVTKTVDVVDQPPGLGSREVRRYGETRRGSEAILAAIRGQLVADLVSAGVLPHERVVDRLAGVSVPEHGGLTLVGDSYGRKVAGLDSGLVERALDDLLAALPDLLGVMLDPTRLGVDLLVLLLIEVHHVPAVIEDHETGTRGALVESSYVLGHILASLG